MISSLLPWQAHLPSLGFDGAMSQSRVVMPSSHDRTRGPTGLRRVFSAADTSHSIRLRLSASLLSGQREPVLREIVPQSVGGVLSVSARCQGRVLAVPRLPRVALPPGPHSAYGSGDGPFGVRAVDATGWDALPRATGRTAILFSRFSGLAAVPCARMRGLAMAPTPGLGGAGLVGDGVDEGHASYEDVN